MKKNDKIKDLIILFAILVVPLSFIFQSVQTNIILSKNKEKISKMEKQEFSVKKIGVSFDSRYSSIVLYFDDKMIPLRKGINKAGLISEIKEIKVTTLKKDPYCVINIKIKDKILARPTGRQTCMNFVSKASVVDGVFEITE